MQHFGERILCNGGPEQAAQAIEEMGLLPLRPVLKQLAIAFVTPGAKLAAKRQYAQTGVIVHVMYADNRRAMLIFAASRLQKRSEMPCQLRRKHIGVVYLAQMLLQFFDLRSDGGEIFAQAGVVVIGRLKNLQRIAQALGGDPHLMQLIDFVGIGEDRLIFQQFLQAGADGESRLHKKRGVWIGSGNRTGLSHVKLAFWPQDVKDLQDVQQEDLHPGRTVRSDGRSVEPDPVAPAVRSLWLRPVDALRAVL